MVNITITALLTDLQNLGVKLWVEDDQLRTKAPKGVITPTLRTQIQTHKAELIEILRQAQQETLSSQAIPRAPRTGRLPLSFAQQRLWFLDQMGAGAAYNVFAALQLTGELDVAALQATLREIVQRHESLRTTFAEHEGEAYQIIHPEATLAVPLVDLRHFPETAQMTEVMRLALAEAQGRFDLSRDLMIRATLLQLSATPPTTSHVLFLTMHHIAVDGWSINVLVHELASLYPAFVQGQASPLPPLPVQYADFAIWQRQWLQGEVLATQLRYWKTQLAGAPELLSLPTDRPRPPVQTYEANIQHVQISAEDTQALHELSRQADATLFMTLLAAFQVLLSRYSGQFDIVVGSPIANRNRQEIESLLGFFVNSLAHRANLAGNPNFFDHLVQVRQTTQDAYTHQDFPFERLVEELQPTRTLNYNPVFQVVLALQSAFLERLELPGLQIHVLPLDFFYTQRVRMDIEVHLWERNGGVDGVWLYNTDLFDATTIERMSRHFQVLLKSILANPHQPVAQLPLLTAPERHQLLNEWNDTATPYPADKCIHELFEEQVERMPDQIAVVFEEKQLTYRELNQRANQLAHYLITLGVQADSLVGICVERSMEMVIGLLGILKAGDAYVPLDPAYPKERLAFMLADAEVSVLLTQAALQAKLPATTAQIVCLDDGPRSSWATLNQQNPSVLVQPHNLAYVIYTSGSTGHPKGTLIVHQGVVRLVRQTNYIKIDEHEVFLQLAPLAFDASTLEVWAPLLNGGRLAIMSPGPASPIDIGQAIRHYGVTTLWLTASLFHLMVEERLADLQPLHQLLAGGDVLAVPQVNKAVTALSQGQLINGYGPTENTTFTCCYTVPKHSVVTGSVPIGKPITNTQVYILDSWMQPVPVGVAGELYIGGAGLARGYLNQPELTVAKFVPNSFGEGRLYKTGDLVRWLPDGNIGFLGRIDHQVKLRGFRIELGEIEATLTSHPAVRETLVMLREDQLGDPRLTAYLIPETSDTATQSEHVQQWQTLYEDTYGQVATEVDLSFNISGWNSSYTGAPIPAVEMAEWVEHTVAELRAVAEKLSVFKTLSFLEIGCGSGLLLARLAPHGESYWGVDYSQQALTQVQRLTQTAGLQNVTLRQRLADDFTGIPSQTFDLVIVNSVVQYFPSLDYLLRVLEGAVQALKPGGIIYLGDIRNFTLLSAYHASVQLYRASDDLTQAELAARVQQHLLDEEELLIAPAFFYTLPQRFPQIQRVEVRLKRGHSQNELTRFRYQVWLHLGTSPEVTTPDIGLPGVQSDSFATSGVQSDSFDWQPADWTLPKLRSYLSKSEDLDSRLILRNVPNARVQQEIQTLAWLGEETSSSQPVADLRQRLATQPSGIDPETFWALGEELSYAVHITWSENEPGGMDVYFYKGADVLESKSSDLAPRKLTAYANNPLLGKWHRRVVPQLREFLQSRLPDYMIPSAWVTLEALPLLPNGKVNRKALPAPATLQRSTSQQMVLPRTATEETLAQIWREVLGVTRIGIHDNFFELGGHSLLATQVTSRIRLILQQEIPLNLFFKQPTVAALAEHIDTITVAHTLLHSQPNQPTDENHEKEIW